MADKKTTSEAQPESAAGIEIKEASASPEGEPIEDAVVLPPEDTGDGTDHAPDAKVSEMAAPDDVDVDTAESSPDDTPANDSSDPVEAFFEKSSLDETQRFEDDDPELNPDADEIVSEQGKPDDDVSDPATPETHGTNAAMAPPPPPVEVKRVGFFPVLFGGILAAGLGAGGLYYADSQGWLGTRTQTAELETQIAAQAEQIAALQQALKDAEGIGASVEANTTGLSTAAADITALKAAAVDLAPIEATLATLGAADGEAETAITDLLATVSDLRARLDTLEVQPIAKAELPAELVAAYEKQLADVLAAVDTRFDEMQKAQGLVVGNIETDIGAKVTAIETEIGTKVTEIETDLRAQLAAIEAAQANANAAEEAALKAAADATARAATARITVALDRGEGFAEPLSELVAATGIEPPAALNAVATDGTPSAEALKSAFPEAARLALAETSRVASEDGSAGSLTSIIMTQLGARSLEPREGDDPDAVLSRAEAAVKAGDLDTALTELAALPESGKAAFDQWVADATALRDARAAAAELSAQYNTQ